MSRMFKVIKGADVLNREVGRAVSWISLLMVLVVTVDVIMRYAFGTSYVFTQELEWHLFGAYFLLGGGYTLLHNAHVRVDIFYQRLTPRQKAWIDFLGVLLFLLPGCYLVITTSWNFAWNSWMIRETSPDPGGIPARYILKAIIPLGFFFIAVQGVSMGLRSLLTLFDRPYEAEQEVGS
jgi:TRAP-type mannitol/chloroaromatic compound transport system permease small subunit